MRCFLLACLLAALSARAQGAPVPAERSQSPAPPPPEAAPPLVQAPGPELGLPPLSEGQPRSLRRGARLRVETQSGQSHSGKLVSLEPGALSLQADPQQAVSLLLADVQRLETRERAVVPGLVTGGVIGAVSGGLFLGMLCAFTGEGADVLPCLAGGGLLGGAAGIGAGAVIGLAVPRWSTRYEKEKHGQLVLRLTEPEDDVLAHWFSGADLMGELGLQLGYARDMGLAQPTDGWGGRAHLLVLIGPYVGLGPELAWYGGVGTVRRVSNSHTTVVRDALWQLGALLRVGSELGPVRASVLGGLDFSDNRTGHAGTSVGGELEVLLGERLPVALDVRYHFNIEREEAHPDPDYVTLGVGSRLRW